MKRKTSFKIIITSIFVIIIITLIYFIYLFNFIQKSKHTGFAKTEELVLDTTNIDHINYIERFQDVTEHHIVVGKTADEIEKIAFVPIQNNDEKVKVINKSDTVSKGSIQKSWYESCEGCQLIQVKPAILDNKPLWEVTYYDKGNRYVFDYYSLYDGSQTERVSFKRKFK